MEQLTLKLIVCALWLAGGAVSYGYPWPRRFFAYCGPFLVSLYWGPLVFARIQQAIDDPVRASVPFIGYTVGVVVGPIAAIALGYWGMRNLWSYVACVALTIAFFAWVHLGSPSSG